MASKCELMPFYFSLQIVRSKCAFPIGEIVNDEVGVKISTGCLSRPTAGSQYCADHLKFVKNNSSGNVFLLASMIALLIVTFY